MSFLKGLGGPLAGGAISPLSGLGMIGGPMSGIGAIGALAKLFGGGGEGGGDEKSGAQVNPGYTPKPNAAASGLGRLINVSPERISKIATSVGQGANQIASAGGAQAGYAPPPVAPAPSINNHMQLLNPEILQQLMRHFSGNSAGGQIR